MIALSDDQVDMIVRLKSLAHHAANDPNRSSPDLGESAVGIKNMLMGRRDWSFTIRVQEVALDIDDRSVRLRALLDHGTESRDDNPLCNTDVPIRTTLIMPSIHP